MNRINSSCTQVKTEKESIILCLCFFPTWTDWFHWLDTSDDWQDGRSLNNQTDGLDKSLQRIFYFHFFPPWCKEIWPCFACVKANILKECAQDIFFAFRTLKRGGKPFWLTVKNICYMVWLSNFPNTRFPLSILRLYSMCLFLNKQWRNIHSPNVATQQNEKSIAFPQCIAHNYEKKTLLETNLFCFATAGRY